MIPSPHRPDVREGMRMQAARARARARAQECACSLARPLACVPLCVCARACLCVFSFACVCVLVCWCVLIVYVECAPRACAAARAAQTDWGSFLTVLLWNMGMWEAASVCAGEVADVNRVRPGPGPARPSASSLPRGPFDAPTPPPPPPP